MVLTTAIRIILFSLVCSMAVKGNFINSNRDNRSRGYNNNERYDKISMLNDEFDPFKSNSITSPFSRNTAPFADPFRTLNYKLKVATFNVWGLVTSKDRDARISAITRYFTKNPRGLDIICFQELWMADDYRTVRAALSLEFPNAHYFKSGAVGSGLAVFSKFPIEDAWWKGFTLTGKAHRIFDGDWFAGKGIGAVRIKHPIIGDIDVFNTHVPKCILL